MNQKYTLSCSYGKDSLAYLGAVEKLGWPLGRVVHAEVWATDTIPADLPEMVEFKRKADKIIKARWGIDVEHICATDKDGEKLTYEKVFYRRRESSRNGNTMHKMYGWPFTKGPWCNDRLKMKALRKIKGITYLGIAADEPERIARHINRPGIKLPLVELGWTEADCRKWCEENDLLSPIYNTEARGGCWFCHNQGVNQLRRLRKNHPELWALMLKWDKDSPVTFHADGHTIHDFDKRFRMEDAHLIDPTKRFRWSVLNRYPQCLGSESRCAGCPMYKPNSSHDDFSYQKAA